MRLRLGERAKLALVFAPPVELAADGSKQNYEGVFNKMSNWQRLYSLEPPPVPLSAAQAFLRHARFRLRADYWAKITRVTEDLDEAQLWWRPNATSNSIGNLLLHLAGNVRQWLVAGVGGVPDERLRAAEFTADGSLDKAALLAQLNAVVAAAEAVLDELASLSEPVALDAELQRLIAPQGFPQTVFDAVFHVVEHFSYHTGQIVLLAKQLNAAPVQLYDEQALNQP